MFRRRRFIQSAVYGNAAGGGGGRVLTARTPNSQGSTSVNYAFPLSLGSGTAFVIIAFNIQNGGTFSSVQINSQSLTLDAKATGGWAAIYSGVITGLTGSDTLNVVSSASFITIEAYPWTLTGNASNVEQQSASIVSAASVSLDVTAGDILIAIAGATSATATYAASTADATSVVIPTPLSTNGTAAYWNGMTSSHLASGTGAFSVHPGVTADLAAVTYK